MTILNRGTAATFDVNAEHGWAFAGQTYQQGQHVDHMLTKIASLHL